MGRATARGPAHGGALGCGAGGGGLRRVAGENDVRRKSEARNHCHARRTIEDAIQAVLLLFFPRLRAWKY